MTRRVADRKEDGFVLLTREPQSFFAPWEPVDRIVCVLLQIRTGLVCEAIGHERKMGPTIAELSQAKFRPEVVNTPFHLRVHRDGCSPGAHRLSRPLVGGID